MGIEFDKKKKQVRSLVVHKDISEIYANNLGASNLSNNAPEEYSSDLFSNLKILGDFIVEQEDLREDKDVWKFLACFWPFLPTIEGDKLKEVYQSLPNQWIRNFALSRGY